MVAHLLHGTLHVTIYNVVNLHLGCGFNPFRKTGGAPMSGKRFVSEMKRFVLCRPEIVGSRLYATIDLEKARVGRTRIIQNQHSKPEWNEHFHIYCAHVVSNVIFTLKDAKPFGAALVGRAYFPVEDIVNGQEVDRWVEIMDEHHHPVHGSARIHISIKYVSVTQDSSWSQGIQSAHFEGVPYSFLKQRQGCKVTLYQDAHVQDHIIPEIVLSGGKYYEPHRCWEDIFDAIANANHLIYITGWSVYTKITLVRDIKRVKPGGDITLGELLKKKANEGVRVLMLVWDDRTSIEPFKKDGLLETHDEETADYFRNTNVRCVLCPRNPDDGRSIVQGFQISTMFTHHQKSLVVDSENISTSGESQKRRIVSFVGGIDLCNGRYDTQHHSLFGTLATTHYDDFHQPNFPGASISKGGPREPWHDIHCKLEGPVAWDVLYNFEQRWKKQVGDQFIIPLIQLDEIIVHPTPVATPEDPERWNVQLFRSIDGGAVVEFPENPNEAASLGLVSGKNNTIDRSIQDAYINAIRRAKRYIYIENQYFLGSSFGWNPSNIKVEDIGALHLIPKELSLKIMSKIEAAERFTVYIVIPMWPEGIPESASVQAILDWQKRTIEMMYTDIAGAVKAKGLSLNLRDYLTFFCLGNREIPKIGEYIPPGEKPEPDSDYSRAQQARRFMIYVHSKLMIVDDEYIIIGSANLNQRSMDGARDSEIAMGGFQPHHLATTSELVKGQIYGFRMALWYEHLGLLYTSFHHPESIECVQAVNQLADENWELYSSATPVQEDLFGHLLRYPIEITKDGIVTALPRFEFFPDTKARVLGTRSDYLPPILTT